MRGKFVTSPRFEGADAWARLTGEQQAEIGAIALEYYVASSGVDANEPPNTDQLQLRIFTTATHIILKNFFWVASEALEAADVNVSLDDVNQILIPSSIGQICRICACSYHDPCEGGCSWTEDDLCSTCAVAS